MLKKAIIKASEREISKTICRLLSEYEKVFNNSTMKEEDKKEFKLSALNFHKVMFSSHVNKLIEREMSGSTTGIKLSSRHKSLMSTLKFEEDKRKSKWGARI